jgi:hypothetical protein
MKKPPGITRGLVRITCSGWQSEAKGEELGAAGGIPVSKGTEADLMGDTGPCDCLCGNADHNAEHGRPSIKKLSSLELLHENQLFLVVLKKGSVRGWVGHGEGNGVVEGFERPGPLVAIW